jgi:hypothetical protein
VLANLPVLLVVAPINDKVLASQAMKKKKIFL